MSCARSNGPILILGGGAESVGGARDVRDICCERPAKKEELTGVAHRSVV
jgi:hypothetical protein